MKSEYVRLNGPEMVYGQKNFLNAQLELLGLIKSLRAYKKMRRFELELKDLLKIKFEEAISSVEKLERLLPKVDYKIQEFAVKKKGRKDKRELSLEEEIREIKNKLNRLQGG